MPTKQPFHEYILAQLRELELTSATLSQVRDKYGAACGLRASARDRCSEHKHNPNRRRALARHVAYYRADAKAHALSCVVDILERRKAVLSDEITRAVLVNALRGICREVFGQNAISGAEIARRSTDLSEAITLTRWLRNIDFARESKLWTLRSDFLKPPTLSDDYVDRILLQRLYGAKR